MSLALGQLSRKKPNSNLGSSSRSKSHQTAPGMPTYRAVGFSANLVTCDLGCSTSSSVSRIKGRHSKKAVDAVLEAFDAGRVLKEQAICEVGSEFPVWFLVDSPFFMVQTGHNVLNPSQPQSSQSPCSRNEIARALPSTEQDAKSSGHQPSTAEIPPTLPRRTPRGFRIIPSILENKPEERATALFLRIQLSKKTFLRNLDGNKQPQDIKIDVYFNGAFTETVMFPSKESGKVSTTYFSGTRVQQLAERPWVMLPPDDRPAACSPMSQDESANDRWGRIGSLLLEEADTMGFDHVGRRPPSGDYLEALSRIAMPDGLTKSCTPGRRQFGAIDIVVSVGKGSRQTSDSHYITKPTRFQDQRFTPTSRKLAHLQSTTVEGRQESHLSKHSEGERGAIRKGDPSSDLHLSVDMPVRHGWAMVLPSPQESISAPGSQQQSLPPTTQFQDEPARPKESTQSIRHPSNVSPRKRRRISRAGDVYLQASGSSSHAYHKNSSQGLSQSGVIVGIDRPGALWPSMTLPKVERSFEVFEDPPPLSKAGQTSSATFIKRIVINLGSRVIRDVNLAVARLITNQKRGSMSLPSSPIQHSQHFEGGAETDHDDSGGRRSGRWPRRSSPSYARSAPTSSASSSEPATAQNGGKAGLCPGMVSAVQPVETRSTSFQEAQEALPLLQSSADGAADAFHYKSSQDPESRHLELGHRENIPGHSSWIVEVGDMSKNSVITYAEPRSEPTGSLTPVLRQVRCQKAGTFSETEVVVGIRFLVV